MKSIFGWCLLLAAIVATPACAGLKGTWEVSGGLNLVDYQRFQGTMTVDPKAKGWAELDFGSSARRRPVCNGRLVEQSLSFMVDGGDRVGSCERPALPYIFRGRLGQHVMTGDVYDASNRKVGMWRAFRRFE